MEEKVSPLGIFSEKLRGLAAKEKLVSMDDVKKLEAYFKRMFEDKEARPDIELTKLVGE